MNQNDPLIQAIFAEMGETVAGAKERLMKLMEPAMEMIVRRMKDQGIEFTEDNTVAVTEDNMKKMIMLLHTAALLGMLHMELFDEYRENMNIKSDLN